MNPYVMEALAQHQLEALRADAAVLSQVRAATPPRPPLRVTLGLALIRVGTWTLGQAHRPLAPGRSVSV